jgi:flavin reductase (DIM6/NTAB) family NADH-FMN oxidoreductase RutF|tara:strand:- start:254 stop:736 length:483 start_codon:yes stop_codon:yes gene_type:complete
LKPSQELFKSAWRNFPTGVSIVTTQTSDGGHYATTANAVMSVSLDPLLVLVSLSSNGKTSASVKNSGCFGLNFLNKNQADLGNYYGRSSSDKREILPDNVRVHSSGVALLEDALSIMVCNVIKDVVAGDHTLFIGEVIDIENREGESLIFYKGEYRTFGI